MTTHEENKQADLTASSQEKPRSEPTPTRAPEEKREIANIKADKNEQRTPPRGSQTSRKTRALPERQQAESLLPAISPPTPAVQAPGALEPSDPPAALADLGWMPPVEDQVARFLNDVADIAPPPVREREGTAPTFVRPSAISPEEAKRKKAKADPFWSQVVATPMEQPEPAPSPPARKRGAGRKRSRRRLRWFLMGGGILLLVVVGLAVVVYKYPGLLPFK